MQNSPTTVASQGPDPQPEPSLDERDYAGRFLAGSLWMIAARWAMRFVGLASTLVLARLLVPEDFGLVAMAMIAYGLLETISWAGVDLALLREGHHGREHYDTAWTIQVLQGCFIAVCLVAAAPWIAAYFSEPRLASLALWIAPRAVIDGLQNIGIVAFRKELDFAKEFRFNVYTKVLGAVLVIAAAFWLRNYWALVIGSLAAGLSGVVLSYAMHPYRPRLTLARASEIWSFSQWLMISRVGTYLNRKCDEFVVGGQVGAALMGTYHVASDLSTLPSNELVMPVRRAMFPSLAKLTHQPAEFQSAVLASFSAIAALCVLAGVLLSATAPQVVAIVLGARWTAAIPLLQLLALFGALSALVLALEVPIWVKGQTQVSALQSWIELASIAPLAWWAVQTHGVMGAAVARVVVSAAMVPLMMALTARAGAATFGALASVLWRPALAGLAVFFVLEMFPTPGWPPVAILVCKVVVGIPVYAASILMLWWCAGRPNGVERGVVEALASRLPPR